MSYFRSRKPSRRRLTEAQVERQREIFASCPATISGSRLAKGTVIQAMDGSYWKVQTMGFSYHEDCGGRVYGAKPARLSKAQKAAEFLRETIEMVLRGGGTSEPFSRGHNDSSAPCPVLERGPVWVDEVIGSLASFPSIEVRGDVVRAVRPTYDDAPTIAWVRDPKLAKRVREAIESKPSVGRIPSAPVKVRVEPKSV